MDHDRAYYTMELIDGADLNKVSKDAGRLAKPESALIEGASRTPVLQNAGRAKPSQGTATAMMGFRPGSHRAGPSLALRLAGLFADTAIGLAYPAPEQNIIHATSNLQSDADRDGRRIVLTDLGLARLLNAKALSQNQMPRSVRSRYMAVGLLEADRRCPATMCTRWAQACELLAGRPCAMAERNPFAPADLQMTRRLRCAASAASFNRSKQPSSGLPPPAIPIPLSHRARRWPADLRTVAEHPSYRRSSARAYRRTTRALYSAPSESPVDVGDAALMPLLLVLGCWRRRVNPPPTSPRYVPSVTGSGRSAGFTSGRPRSSSTFRSYVRKDAWSASGASTAQLRVTTRASRASWLFIHDSDSDRVQKDRCPRSSRHHFALALLQR